MASYYRKLTKFIYDINKRRCLPRAGAPGLQLPLSDKLSVPASLCHFALFHSCARHDTKDLRIMEKVLVGLHKAHTYTVHELIARIGWGLKEFRLLHPTTLACITASDYRLFCHLILCFPTVYTWVHAQQPHIADMLQVAPAVGIR